MPAPAAKGSNVPPRVTPGPLYVPPDGEPPLNANAAVLIHVRELSGQLTEDTVIVKMQLLLHPVEELV